MATRVAVPNIFRWMPLSQDPGAPPSDPVDTWSNMIWNPHWFLPWDLFDLSLLFFLIKLRTISASCAKRIRPGAQNVFLRWRSWTHISRRKPVGWWLFTSPLTVCIRGMWCFSHPVPKRYQGAGWLWHLEWCLSEHGMPQCSCQLRLLLCMMPLHNTVCPSKVLTRWWLLLKE